MESKTVIEWLEQAKAEGYEWAERAIEVIDKSQPSSLSEALTLAFEWDDTIEGHSFWERIYEGLRSQGK